MNPQEPVTASTPKPKSKTWRFNAQRVLLTYRTHINKQDFTTWLVDLVPVKINTCRIAHEAPNNDKKVDFKGEEITPYEHTHVVIEFSTRLDTKNVRYFDYRIPEGITLLSKDGEILNSIHPNIVTLGSAKALRDALVYIAKEDPENADLLRQEEPKKSAFKRVAECATIQEALDKVAGCDPGKASGVISLWNYVNQEITLDESDIPNHVWQKWLMSKTAERITPEAKRNIIWICDFTGNTGKTQLARYLMIKYPSQWFCSEDLGTSRDGATVISNALSSGWTQHGMIVDLPRSAENHGRIYAYLESIKNGMVTTQKYSGRTFIFNQPYIVVFANWLPQFYRLSRDRWDVHILRKNDEGDILPVPYIVTDKDMIDPRKDDDTNHTNKQVCSFASDVNPFIGYKPDP